MSRQKVITISACVSICRAPKHVHLGECGIKTYFLIVFHSAASASTIDRDCLINCNQQLVSSNQYGDLHSMNFKCLPGQNEDNVEEGLFSEEVKAV